MTQRPEKSDEILQRTGPLALCDGLGVVRDPTLKSLYESARVEISDLQQLLLRQQQERAADQLRLHELSTRVEELAAGIESQRATSQRLESGLAYLESKYEANSAALWGRIAPLEVQAQRFQMFYGSAPLRLVRKIYRALHGLLRARPSR